MTREQYIRSSKVTYPSIMAICTAIVLMQLAGGIRNGMAANVIWQMVLIVIAMIVETVFFITKKDCKLGMIVMAGMGGFMYLVLSFLSNMEEIFAIGFVVLFISMSYLNKKLIICGNLIIIFGFIVHAIRMQMRGTLGSDMMFIAVLTIAMCCISSISAIEPLMKYSQESLEVIETKAAAQEKAAEVMQEVAEEIATRFVKTSDYLTALNNAILSNDTAMKDISDSTNSTAESMQEQAGMCAEIQKETDEAEHGIERMSNAADTVKGNIGEGVSLIADLKEQAAAVDEVNRTTIEAVTNLSDRVQEVKNITATILDISSQTNLLALNASIEAARAGEAGRGFAVVADEIRVLSENTKESANKITDIIAELVSDVEATSRSIYSSSQTIEKQSEMIDNTKESFGVIEVEVNSLIKDIYNTEQLMKKILGATNVISDHITNISSTSEEIAASSAEGVSISGKAVEDLEKVNVEFQTIYELSKKLKETV